jgi:hypothetical protein
MTSYYRIAGNSIQADEDRRAMGRFGLEGIFSIPYSGNCGSRYLTAGNGELPPDCTLLCAKLP